MITITVISSTETPDESPSTQISLSNIRGLNGLEHFSRDRSSSNSFTVGDSAYDLELQEMERRKREAGEREVLSRDGRGRGIYEHQEVIEIIRKYFPENTSIATAIAKAESGLNPEALGDTNTKYPSAGIFQIRLLPNRGITKEQMFQVEENVKYARKLYESSGWNPWSVWKNGSYEKYLEN